MGFEEIWAPWRLPYIKATQEKPPAVAERLRFLPGADPQCFLCQAVADEADRERLVVFRSPESVVVLNRFPYNNGHLLVAPRLHRGRLDELDAGQHGDLMAVTAQMVSLLERLLNAEGFNVGLNLGRVAGAGLPGHLHWHIVPRWNGDTNFMPVLGSVNVIPQSLEALWEAITEAAAGG